MYGVQARFSFNLTGRTHDSSSLLGLDVSIPFDGVATVCSQSCSSMEYSVAQLRRLFRETKNMVPTPLFV